MAQMSTLIGAAGITIKEFLDFPWALILNGAMSGIEIYVLRIMLLVLIIKIVLSPLDFYQRYKMRKNQIIQKRIKPQMEKLEKAYGNYPQVLQQKQAQLNKREGMSTFASCLPMIVTLGIFIWFWQTLSATAQYKQFDSYMQIYGIYAEAYSSTMEDYYDENTDGLSVTYAASFRDAYSSNLSSALSSPGANVDEALETSFTAALASSSTESYASTGYYPLYVESYDRYFRQGVKKYIVSRSIEDTLALANEAGSTVAISSVNTYCGIIAQNDVHDFYFGEGKYEGEGYKRDSFLWIKDIWNPDVPWATSVKGTQEEFVSGIGQYATNPELSGIDETLLNRAVSSYSDIMSAVIADTDRISVNGFLILPVIAVGLNVLSQLITRRQQKASGQQLSNDSQMGCMNNGMLFIFPVMIGFFAIQYSAAFALYMLTNTGLSLIINLITSLATKKMVPNDGVIVTNEGDIVEKYGRPDVSKD